MASQIRILGLCFFFLCVGISSAFSQGLDGISITDQKGREVSFYQKSYALLIGVSEYSENWADLANIPKEIQNLEVALERHGFQVEKKTRPN